MLRRFILAGLSTCLLVGAVSLSLSINALAQSPQDLRTMHVPTGLFTGGTYLGVSYNSGQLITDYQGAGFQTNAISGSACVDVGWDVALRYAGEFSGFRVAARDAPAPFVGVVGSLCTGKTATALNPFNFLDHTTRLGWYGTFGGRVGVYIPTTTATFPYLTMSANGGLAFGNVAIQVPGFLGADGTRTGFFLGGEIAVGVTPWGARTVQNIDAAAMELYTGFRHFDLGTENAQFGGPVPVHIEINEVFVGARIRF